MRISHVVRQASIGITVASLIFSPIPPAFANPQGAEVVHGNVDFSQQGDVMTITSSRGAIIDWQSFSIAQGELTRFQQEAADSAVLNRVVSGELSTLRGQLESNGQVFLINPNGIVFGQHASIDTAGFVASTLAMSDEDFRNGAFRFQGDADSGRIVNEGFLSTSGGNVYFIAPDIENSGIIHSESGSLILAAGESVRITSLESPSIRFEIQAPANQVLNLGQILADQGSVHAFAGSLTHSGDIRADSVAVADDGSIILSASHHLELAAGSTVQTSGATGGNILVDSGAGTLLSQADVRAEGSDGSGGEIRMLGNEVALFGAARVSADGTAGGGTVLIGGNRSGQGPEENARATFVGSDTHITASALESGDGGTIIAFSEEVTRAYGTLEARGGDGGGDGGFIETSGSYIEVTRTPDAGADAGNPGEWLIDPDLFIIGTGGLVEVTESPTGFFTVDATPAAPTIQDTLLEAAVDGGTSITVDTAGNATNIVIQQQLDFNATTPGLFVNFISQTGGIDVQAPIINTGTQGLGITFNYDDMGQLDIGADINAGPGGFIDLAEIGGSGTLAAFSGSPVLTGDIFGADLDIGTADVTFNGNTGGINSMTITGSGSAIINQTVGFGIQDLVMNGGTLDGSANIDVLNSFQMNDGASITGSGTLLLDSASTSSINGSLNKGMAGSRVLSNDGSITWNDGSILFSDTAQFINNGTMTINLTSSRQFDRSAGTPGFTSNGTLNKQDGNTATFDLITDLAGNVNVMAGTLALTEDSNITANFVTDSGAITEFSGGTHMLLPGADLAGMGAYEATGGSAQVLVPSGNSVIVSNFDITGATVGGDGILDVRNTFDWTTGNLGTTGEVGTLLLAGGATGNISTSVNKGLRGDYTLAIDGLMQWNDGSVLMTDNASVNIGSGGTLRSLLGTQRIFDFSSGAPTLVLAPGGNIEQQGTANALFDIPVMLDGNVSNTSAAELQFTRGGTSAGTFNADTGATIRFQTNGSSIHDLNGSFMGTGTYAFSGVGGQSNVNAVATYNVGSTFVDGGNVFFEPASSITGDLTLDSGNLNGDGEIGVQNNFLWSGASNFGGNGVTRLLSTSTGTINNSLQRNIFGARQLVNEGSLSWQNGSVLMHDTSQIINDNIWNIDLTSSRVIDRSTGTPQFVNNATLNHNTEQTSTFDVDNLIGGTINLNSTAGIMTFSRTSTLSGNFQGAGTGTVELSSGTHTLANGAMLGSDYTFEFAAGTTTIDPAIIVPANHVLMTGGILRGDGDLTFNDTFTLRSGTLGGSGDTGTFTLAAPATGSIETSINKNFVGDGTFNVLGTLNWNDGTFILNDNTSLSIGSGGTLRANLSSSRSIDRGTGTPSLTILPGGTLDNIGTAIATIDVQTFNDGSVTNNGGVMNFSRGGTHAGSFTAASGSTIGFSDSNGVGHDLDGTHTGAGIFQFSGNGVSIVGAGASLDVGEILVDTGTVDFLPAVVMTDDLTMTGGILGGSSEVQVTNALLWQGGIMDGTGTTRLMVGSNSVIDNTLLRTLSESRTLRNEGSVVWNNGNINMADSAQIVNDGSWNIALSIGRTIDFVSGTPQFVSNGSINKSTGLTANFDVDTILNGTLTQSAGSLNFTRGSTMDATVTLNGGIFRLSGGVSPHLLTTNADFSGAGGFLEIDSGTTIIDDGATVGFQNLNLVGGELGGNGTANVTGLFTWEGGILGRSGDTGNTRLTGSGTGVINTSATKQIRGDYTLQVDGGLTWNDGNVNLADTAGVELQSGATFTSNLNASSRAFGRTAGTPSFNVLPGATFTNSGSQVATIDVTFNNDGIVDGAGTEVIFNRGGTHAGAFAPNALGRVSLADTSGAGHTINGSVGGAGQVRYGFGTVTVTGGATFNSAHTIIDGGGTLRIDGITAQISELDILNGTLDGSGEVQVTGNLDWVGGTVMTGSGITRIMSGATGLMDNFNTRFLNGSRQLINEGTLDWQEGNIFFDSTSQFINDATFNIVLTGGDYRFDVSGGTPTFVNNNTMTMNTVQVADFFIPVTINGTVNVTDGTMKLSRASLHGANYTIGATGDVQFLGSSVLHTLDNGASLTGPGSVTNGGGTVLVEAGETATIENYIQNNFSGITGGDGTLEISGGYDWSQGDVGRAGDTGTVRLLAGSTSLISVFGDVGLRGDIELENLGTLTWTEANVQMHDNATFTNAGVMNVDLLGPQSIDLFSGTPQFVNTGTFNVLATSADLTFRLPFTNMNQVNVDTTTLRLETGSTTASGWNVVNGGLLELAGGLHDFAGGSTLTGDGATTLLATSELRASSGAVSSTNFVLAGGTVTGAGELQITDALNWLDGTIGNVAQGGTLRLTGTSTNSIATSAHNIDSGLLITDSGSATTWSGGDFTLFNSAQIQIDGDLAITGDNTIFTGDASNPFFQLNGTLTKSAGAGTTDFQLNFDNDGIVNGNSGTLLFSGDGVHDGDFFENNPALITFAGGTTNTINGNFVSGSDQLFDNQVMVVNGSFSANNVTIQNNSAITFNDDYTAANTFVLNTSSATFNDLATTGGLTVDNSTIDGPSTLSVTGAAALNNANISFSGGIDFGGGSSVTGTGAVFNGSGSYVFNGSYDLGTTTLQSGFFDFNSTGGMTDNLSVSGGTLAIEGDLDVDSGFTLGGGQVDGAGTLIIGGIGNITGGTQRGTGITVVDTGATLSLGVDHNLSESRTLQVDGTFNLDGNDTQITVFDDAVIDNRGTFEINGSGDLLDGTNGGGFTLGSALFNTGTINKNAEGSGGSTIISLQDQHNDGTFNIPTGTIVLQGGGSHAGTFNTPGGVLQLNTGTHILLNGASVTGTGGLQVAGGTLQVQAGDVAFVDRLNANGGNVVTEGTLQVDDQFNWTASNITGTAAGELLVSSTAGGIINTTSNKFLGTTNLRILSAAANPLVWQDGVILMSGGATIEIGAGGVLQSTQNNGALNRTTGFNNNETLAILAGGLFERNGSGTLTSDVRIDNDGRTNMIAGAASFSLGGNSSGEFAANGGTFNFNGGTHVIQSGASFTGTSFHRVTAGTVTVDAGATVAATNVGVDGGFLDTDGTLNISAAFEFTAGSVGGDPTGLTDVLPTASGLITTTNNKFIDTGRLRIGSGIANPTMWDNGVILMTRGGRIEVDGVLSSQQVGGALNRTTGFDNSETLAILSGGLFERNGSGTLVSDVRIDNDGRTNMIAGAASFSLGGISSGEFGANGGTFNFNGGTHVIQPGASFTGTSFNRITAGTVTIDAGATVAATRVGVNGGFLDTDGTLNISDAFEFTAGSVGGDASGLTHVLASASGLITSTNNKFIDTGRLRIGSGIANPTVWDNGVILMTRGGRLEVDGVLSSQQVGGALNRTTGFDNTETLAILSGGLFERNGSGTLVSDVRLDNDGRTNMVMGAASFSLGGTSSGEFGANGGTFNFNGGTHVIQSGASFTGTSFNRVTAGVVRIDSAATVAATNIGVDSGFLDTDGTLNIADGFEFLGGIIGGDAGGLTDVLPTASGLITTGNNKTIDTGRLRIGSAAANPTIWNDGVILMTRGGRLEIDGVLSSQQTGGALNRTTGFDNSETLAILPGGLFERNATGTMVSDVRLDNDGRTNMIAGAASFSLGGTSSGEFAANGGTLNFNGDTHTILAGASFTGSSFNRITAGTVTIDSGATVAATNIGVDGGFLDTDGTLTISDGFEFTSGTVGGDASGLTEVLSTASGLITTGNNKTLDTGRLRIGSGIANPTIWDNGAILMTRGARLEIDGVLRATQNNGALNRTTFFNNNETLAILPGGLFERDGSGTLVSDVRIDNDGRTNMLSGAASFSLGGTSSGEFAANGGTFNFNGGTHVIQSGAAFTGSTFNRVTAGTVTIDSLANVNATNIGVDGGFLDTDGLLTITSRLEFTGGSIGGDATGETRVQASGIAQIFGTNTKTIDTGVLRIDSSGIPASWSDGAIVMTRGGRLEVGGELNITVNNPSLNRTTGFNDTETFAILPGGTVNRNGSGGFITDVLFENAGTFANVLGTSTFSRPVTLTGDVDIFAGQVNFNVGGTASGTQFFTDAGATLNFNNAVFTLSNGAALNGTGTVIGTDNLDFGAGDVFLNMPMTFTNETVATTGAIIIQDVITVQGIVQFQGDVRNENTLIIVGTDAFGDAQAIAPNFLNTSTGIVRLTSTASGIGAIASLNVSTGLLTNEGTIEFLAGNGGTQGRQLITGGYLSQGGVLDIGHNGGVIAPVGFQLLGASRVNVTAPVEAGFAVNPASGGEGIIADTSVIDVVSGGSFGNLDLAMNGPANIRFQGGSLTGAGTIDFSPGNFLIEGAPLTIAGVTFIANDLEVGAGRVLDVIGATLDITNPVSVLGGGVLQVFNGDLGTSGINLTGTPGNLAQLAVLDGTLTLAAGGSAVDALVSLSEDTTLSLGGGTFDFGDRTELDGDTNSSLTLTGGTLQVSGVNEGFTLGTRLSLNSTNIAGNGVLNIADTLQATGSTRFDGQTNVVAGGTLQLAAAGAPTSYLTNGLDITSGTLTLGNTGGTPNGATVDVAGALAFNDALFLFSDTGAPASHLVEAQTISFAGTNAITGMSSGAALDARSGALNMSNTSVNLNDADFSLSTPGIVRINDTTWMVDQSSVALMGGATINVGTSTFDVNNSALLEFDLVGTLGVGLEDGVRFNLSPTSALSVQGPATIVGTGTHEFFGGSVSITSITQGQGSLEVTSNLEVTDPSLLIGGTTRFAGTTQLGGVTLDGGSLINDGSQSVDGTFTWNSGAFSGTGTTTIAASGEFAATGAGLALDGQQLVNASNRAGNIISSPNFVFANGASLSNTGTLRLDGSATGGMNLTGDGSITNSGVLTVDAGTVTHPTLGLVGGSVQIAPQFDNDGSITLERGFLRLNGGGTHTGSFTGLGMLTDLTDGRFRFGGTHVLESSVAFSATSFGVTSGTTTVNTSLNNVESVFAQLSGHLVLNTALDVGSFSLFAVEGQPLPMVTSNAGITVRDTFTSQGGTLAGSGLLTVASTATGTVSAGPLFLDGVSVENDGDLTIDRAAVVLGGGSFTNDGLLSFNGIGASIEDAFGAGGSFTHRAGVLSAGLDGDATAPGQTSAAIRTDAISIQGDLFADSGLLELFAGGTTQMQGDTTIGGTLVLKGTSTIDAGATITGSNLELVGFDPGQIATVNGAVNVSALAIAADAVLNTGITVGNLTLVASEDAGVMRSPTITNNAAQTVSGTLAWRDATVTGSGSVTIASTGMLLTEPGDSVALDDHTLINQGTGSLLGSDVFQLNGTSILNNQGTLTLIAGSDGILQITGTGTIANSGTLNVDGGVITDPQSGNTFGGNVLISTRLDNAGTVNALAGFVRLQNGGTHSGDFTGVGTRQDATAGRFRFDGTHLLDASSTFNGPSLGVVGGTTTVNGALATESLFVFDGAALELNTDLDTQGLFLFSFNDRTPALLSGTGNVVVRENFELTAGTVTGSGSFELASTASGIIGDPAATTAPVLTFDGRSLVHGGSTGILGNGEVVLLNGAGFTNTGTFILDATNTGFAIKGGANSLFDHSGSISGSSTIELAVPVTSSGTLGASDLTLTNEGSLELSGAVTASGTFFAQGPVNLAGGSIDAAPMQLTGTLTGNGTINGNLVNDGVIAPGTSPGAITVNGNFTQGPNGQLLIEIDGNAEIAGQDYDVLTVTGIANLDGTIAFTTLEGFSGTLGGTFTPVSFGSSSGNFQTVQQPDSATGLTLTLNPAGVQAQVTELNGEVLETGPIDPGDVNPDEPPVPENREDAETIADVVAEDRGTSQEQIETSDDVIELNREQEGLEDCDMLERPEPEQRTDDTQGVGCRSA